MQEKDGAWEAQGQKSCAITGLAVMAFLSAGHVPGEGPYAAAVEKGVRWVLSRQRGDGLIALDAEMGIEMYHHGICTLLLAEVAGMTDTKLGKDCRKALEKALALILKAQTTTGPGRGGWRYRPDSNDADVSVTGWQMLALRAAKNLACDIPPGCIERAAIYLHRCHDSGSGGYCYQPGSAATVPCTGTAVLCLEICRPSRPREREILQAGSYLLKNPIQWNSAHFFYSVYYGAQATFQLGNNYWNFYRPQLHKVLFANQQANGSWLNAEGFGPNYSTAMAVLALTVEYRFLPIYQRAEEPAKK